MSSAARTGGARRDGWSGGGPGARRVAVTVLAVAILGEVKVNPFGTAFRFGLGPAGYAFAAISAGSGSWVVPGLFTLAGVLVFRTCLGYVFAGGKTMLAPLLAVNFPGAAYYMVFAALLTALRVSRRVDRPLAAGAGLTIADTGSNLFEMALRGEIDSWIGLPARIGLCLLVAVIRSCLVLGLFYIINEQHREHLREQERKKHLELLLMVTGLRTEALFLEKASMQIEHLAVHAYKLYRQLQDTPAERVSDLAPELLELAKQMHEVKKAQRRIVAGMKRAVPGWDSDAGMKLSEVCRVAVDANEEHARRLGKDVRFRIAVGQDASVVHIHALLSILDNLLSNAVEAIPGSGEVVVDTAVGGADLLLTVRDNGVGIPAQDAELIFTPGYSTKFDPVTGEPSTGMGLPAVRELARNLGGEVWFQVRDGWTAFTVRLPRHQVFA